MVEKQPFRVALADYSTTYSPFFSEGEFDALITKLTGVRLLPRTESVGNAALITEAIITMTGSLR